MINPLPGEAYSVDSERQFWNNLKKFYPELFELTFNQRRSVYGNFAALAKLVQYPYEIFDESTLYAWIFINKDIYKYWIL